MRVIFDIGHGSDTWPPSKGVKLPDGTEFAEHTFNSAVAMASKILAEKQGFEVLLTQQPNSPEVRLGTRCEWANAEHRKKQVACLVSFHANASDNKKATGWGVFYWHSSAKGKRLAELWAKYAAQLLPLPRWGTGIWQCKPDSWSNFDIVRKPVMPCILIEHFFFTNFDELKKCNTPEFIALAAEVTVRALCEYVGIPFQGAGPVTGYKMAIQERCKFSHPEGVWEYLDKHPYAADLYRKWAESYKTPG